MYSLVPSRPMGYLIKYNLFTPISDLSDLYINSHSGRLADKDRVTHASFTLHLNLWTTHVYLNTGNRNRITRLVDDAKISLGSTISKFGCIFRSHFYLVILEL